MVKCNTTDSEIIILGCPENKQLIYSNPYTDAKIIAGIPLFKPVAMI